MDSAKWYVTFALALTDETIGTFDCNIGSLQRYVSKTGQLEASVPIVSPQIGKQLAPVIGGEGRMTAYVYYGNELWWGGFLDETRLVSSSDGGAELSLSGSTFETYVDRREARTDKVFTGTEQTEIARWLWDYIQGTGPGSNLLITTDFPRMTTATLDIEWKRSEARTVGAILKEVSNRVDGFEWIIDTYNDNGNRRRALRVGYPTLGRPRYDMTLTFPGNIMSYEIEGSALDGATSFQARGKAPDPVGVPNSSRGVYDPKTGETTIVGGGAKGSEETFPAMSDEFHSTDFLRRGYVRTDATIEQDEIEDVAELNKWAELARAMRSGPLVLPSVTVRLDGMTQAILGSEVQLRIRDHPFPDGPYGEPGYSYTARCIGYEIRPGEFGAPNIANIIFENPYDEDAQRKIPK